MTDIVIIDQLQVAIAFLLYIFVFGWIGWRRGMNRELVVFAVSVITIILVRLQGDVLITMFNLAWKLFVGITSGALNGADGADFGSIPDLIIPCTDTVTACNATGYLFLFWVFVVILAYLFGTFYVKKSPSNGWAVLTGIANGFVYASVVLPRLFALINPEAINLDEPFIFDALIELLGAAWTSITGVISVLWESVGTMQPYLLLLFLILLIVGAASTLRTKG